MVILYSVSVVNKYHILFNIYYSFINALVHRTADRTLGDYSAYVLLSSWFMRDNFMHSNVYTL